MVERDNRTRPARQSPGGSDLLIIGGGVMGLWCAHFARLEGLSVHLVDGTGIAAGASGGLLGALMAHMPDRWSDKKQFQFDALVALEADIAALEAETGLSAGYRRAGRLIPLPKPHLRHIALRHEQDAQANWQAGDRRFFWHVRDPGFAGDRIAAEEAAAGFVEDTLAARVNPRGLTTLLAARLSADPGFQLTTGQAVRSLDAGAVATFADGTSRTYGHAVIAAGPGSDALLAGLCRPFGKPAVTAVKGQAALLAVDLGADAPVIYRDGLYVVPHEAGQVAIGSTSEMRFDQPFSTDGQLDDLLAAARALVPALAQAPVIERWAGLRPRAVGRDPMVGPLPEAAGVSVLTGGFKVSFGIAHVLGRRLAQAIATSQAVEGLPAGFDPTVHLALARASA